MASTHCAVTGSKLKGKGTATLCRFFNSKRGCRNGALCKWRHASVAYGAPAPAVASSLRSGLVGSSSSSATWVHDHASAVRGQRADHEGEKVLTSGGKQAAKRRRKGKRKGSTGSRKGSEQPAGGSLARPVSEQGEAATAAPAHIPGFYFDPAKNRYFKGTRPPAAAATPGQGDTCTGAGSDAADATELAQARRGTRNLAASMIQRQAGGQHRLPRCEALAGVLGCWSLQCRRSVTRTTSQTVQYGLQSV